MKPIHEMPLFEAYLPDLNGFIHELVRLYKEGGISSWDDLEEKVNIFFTPQRMEQMEFVAPGWQKMASYSGGVTLVHVMCVFLGLFMLPEYQNLSQKQKQLANWIVLFHDVEKVHDKNMKDLTHGFRGGALAARTLNRLGFAHKKEYDRLFMAWSELVSKATIKPYDSSDDIQDNSKLPEIMEGIKKMFGENTPAALVTKGVVLRMGFV
jgi:hypothetical protein